MMRPINSIVLLALLVGVSGCSTLYKRVDPGIDEDITVDEVPQQAGETHFHEVLDLLGPPSRMTSSGSGFSFLYESMLIRELQTGIGGQSGWWQLIKLSFADARLFRHTVIMNFNDEGILLAASFSDSAEPLGRSGSIQPILSLQQIVDTGRFEDDAAEAISWGMSLLDDPAVTLNANQSLRSGSAGFEQSGTTTKVGQNTLEMRKD